MTARHPDFIMNLESIVEKFKEQLQKQGAPEFEIFLLKENRAEVEVKEQKVHSFESAETVGAGLRLIRQKRLGSSYTTDFTDAAVAKAVEEALATARYPSENEFLRFPSPSKNPSNQTLRNYDKKVTQVTQAQRIEQAMLLERSALGFDPKIKRVRGASYDASSYEILLANSWGLQARHQKTMNVLSLMAVAEQGGEAEAAFDFEFSNFFDSLDAEKVGRRAAEKAARYLGGKPGPTLKCPILLDALVAAEILEVLAPSFYADNLAKKCSLFEGLQGKKVLSEALTIIDDGLLDGGFVSSPFDGEGVSRQRMKVVEKGVFRQILADTEYGNRLGMGSTGSSVREDIKKAPRIGCSNFFIEKGTRSPEEILKKIDRGVLITELIGMHTANPISGDFSVGAQGFLVEKGEVAGPIKQIALSGNLKEMMQKVTEAASDLRFYFKVGAPSLLISEMDVAGE
ncbi:MAG: TldD/PmbA family protein [bacterium]